MTSHTPQSRAGTYLLYRAFHPRHLGQASAIPEGPWSKFTDAPSGYWADRVRKVGALGGDAITPATDGFIDSAPDPLYGLVAHSYAPVISGLGLGGQRSLAVELFGRRHRPLRPREQRIAVADNHVHGGLAYDRRSLLVALVRRTEKIHWLRSDALTLPRGVILSSAVRWSIWLLESLIDQGSWEMPDYIAGNSGMAEAWSLVVTGGFWPMIRRLLEGIEVSSYDERIFVEQIQEANSVQIASSKLDLILDRWKLDGPSRTESLVQDLIEAGICDLRGLGVLPCGGIDDAAIGKCWPYGFAINTIRACVQLFDGVPSWPGEGFALFQNHCAEASGVRKLLLTSTRRADSVSAEIESVTSSVRNSLHRYPSPYYLDGFELRREIDPHLNPDFMSFDILSGVGKQWRVYDSLRKFPTLATEVVPVEAPYHVPNRFCAPISFQRPRGSWSEVYGPNGVDSEFRTKGPSRRFADPWEQLHYAGSVVLAIRASRKSIGTDVFDRAVGSVDVSGIEIGHATWPYVSAINLLLEEGCGLSYTAHAGESFERGFTGLRTIGQLFFGSKFPDRVGHASALDGRMRRMIAKQHVHNFGSRALYRFDDYLQDLCFAFTMHQRLGSRGSSFITCRELLTELTACSTGWAIEPQVWVEAFLWLHSSAAARFAVQALESGLVWHEKADAEELWRSVAVGRPKSFVHAVQQFAFGRVIDRDMGGRTPTAASNGVPQDLERRMNEFFEETGQEVAGWVLDMVVDGDTLIECCPTSNLALAGAREYEDHPLWAFLKARNVRFSVNSDDPLVFGGFAGEELVALQSCYESDVVGLGDHLAGLSVAGSDHSVVPRVDDAFCALVLQRVAEQVDRMT